MTATIQQLSELSPPTETSPVNSPLTGEQKSASTLPATGVVIHTSFEPALAPLPAGFSDIDDFIDELEQEQRGREDMADSRRWLADEFYQRDETLASLRLQAGLSQAQLADKLSTSQSQVAKLESGRHDPQLTTLERLSKFLGVDLMTVVNAVQNTRAKEESRCR